MTMMGPSPFTWLEFDQDGALVDPGAQAALGALLAPAGVTDLVVMSHGWKNDKTDATTLYGTLWGNACRALKHRDPAAIAVCGVLWPAKAYQDDFDTAAATGGAGTLAVGSARGSRDLDDDEWAAVLADLRDVFGDTLPTGVAIEAATAAADGITAQRANALFAAGGALIQARGAPRDSELDQDAAPIVSGEDARGKLLGLASPPVIPATGDTGGTQGLGDALGQVIQGARAAAARFLNQLTYFEMKQRAGLIGQRLGAAVLPALAPPQPVRLHLVGHSFGGRLVTAAASALPTPLKLDFFSLTLLQGAFSHNALAREVEPGTAGAFPNVVGRPSGPIAITHTHNDEACTIAYALASRLSRDTTSALGDKDDMFGAMGANGAQKLAASVLAPEGTTTSFAPQRHKVNDFLADAYIVKTDTGDAHNNVTNPTCGKLLAAVIEA